VNNATATTTISFTPSSSPSSAVKSTSVFGRVNGLWGAGFGAALLLVGIFGFAGVEPRNGRNFLMACGLLLCAADMVWACGGGGGRGGGPVSTTTTIVSSNLHAGFDTPVTFTVSVKPNGSASPSGSVQLYDNGQVYGSAVRVSAGIATFLATTLPVGVHNLTADYQGDANTQPSNSAPIAQVITGSVPMQISGAADGITQLANFIVTVI
jgi:hypothetical protein